MVELTDQDKANILSMDTGTSRYAIFADDEDMSTRQLLAWMNEGPVKASHLQAVHDVSTPEDELNIDHQPVGKLETR